VTLTEALTILQRQPADGKLYEVWLACGHTPLYLEKLLAAEIQQCMPERRVVVRTGLFGDLAGTLESLRDGTEAQAAAVAIEWPDLDPRLGYRQLGGWGPAQEADLSGTVRGTCARIQAAIEALGSLPVAVSLPTLPPALAFHTAGWQAGAWQWEVEGALADFARSLARLSNVRISSRDRIDALSRADRRDLKADLLTGIPYPMAHASAIAQVLALLVQPPAPKKGLITDLDDTLWHGIVGEVGPEAVTWDLASHQQIHGLYQQLLRALAESGVLVAIASKNDPATVEQALKRPDLILTPDKVFPIEAHWQAKSSSVTRILETWNISADAVVFVDDSSLELAEVAAAHPGITCLEFPRPASSSGGASRARGAGPLSLKKTAAGSQPASPAVTNHYSQALALFEKLRDLFGKPHIAEEDAYRLESIRQAAEFQQITAERGSAPEELLASLNAQVTLDLSLSEDARVLELVNKTNQFNLNGTRHTDADWKRNLQQPEAFLAAVSYTDKFGPLGKIAVLQGRVERDELHIDTWVMSCRAFSRRVEHQCLAALFEQFEAQAAVLNFIATKKNGPLREFLEQLLSEPPKDGTVRIDRAAFTNQCPRLYHALQIANPALPVRGGVSAAGGSEEYAISNTSKHG
jgi:HAD superfamily phosphatase (TIGR01681 family)